MKREHEDDLVTLSTDVHTLSRPRVMVLLGGLTVANSGPSGKVDTDSVGWRVFISCDNNKVYAIDTNSAASTEDSKGKRKLSGHI